MWKLSGVIINLVVFGALAWLWWDASDRFHAGMFFAFAVYPLVSMGLDAIVDKLILGEKSRR